LVIPSAIGNISPYHFGRGAGKTFVAVRATHATGRRGLWMQGKRARAVGVAAVSLVTMVAVAATHHVQAAPRTHRLEVTPSTVAYGYYWSEARPALRIESGDIIDVDTLLTNTPDGLKRAGVADEKIQA